MTNLELAQYCKNTECRKCDVDIKKQCLQNDCWKAEKISDRCCPAVYAERIQTAIAFRHYTDFLLD